MATLKREIHNLAEWCGELEERLAAAEQQIVDLMSELEAKPVSKKAGAPAKSAEK